MKRNMKSKILFIIFYLKRFKIKIESSQINNNTPNGGDNEKDTQEIPDMKYVKDIQRKLFDLEKNFKSYCLRVNIDNLKNEIKNINDSMGDLNLSFNNDVKSVMENLSKK